MAHRLEISLWFNGLVFNVFISKDCMSFAKKSLQVDPAKTEAGSTRSFRLLHERLSKGHDDGVRGAAEFMAS